MLAERTMWRPSRVVDLVSRSRVRLSAIAPFSRSIASYSRRVSSLGLTMRRPVITVDQSWSAGFKLLGRIVQTYDRGNA